ncbi:MAG: hypothetical protein IJ228_06270 [Succinivibrio sp.]|nr:hypothetical protein [Succinivibrio sp.]
MEELEALLKAVQELKAALNQRLSGDEVLLGKKNEVALLSLNTLRARLDRLLPICQSCAAETLELDEQKIKRIKELTDQLNKTTATFKNSNTSISIAERTLLWVSFAVMLEQIGNELTRCLPYPAAAAASLIKLDGDSADKLTALRALIDTVTSSLSKQQEEVKAKVAEIEDYANTTKQHNQESELTLKRCDELQSQCQELNAKCQAILEQCQLALNGSTNVKLAAAFERKSEKLASEIWVWTIILCAAMAGLLIGALFRATLILPQQGIYFLLGLLLTATILFPGIWLGWFAVKRINALFRLKEDYDFKAVAATTYNGYRDELKSYGEELVVEMAQSVLRRYDEAPLRLLDGKPSSSPFHEILGHLCSSKNGKSSSTGTKEAERQ